MASAAGVWQEQVTDFLTRSFCEMLKATVSRVEMVDHVILMVTLARRRRTALVGRDQLPLRTRSSCILIVTLVILRPEELVGVTTPLRLLASAPVATGTEIGNFGVTVERISRSNVCVREI